MTIKSSISPEEALRKARHIVKILNTMKVGDINSDVDFEGVMTLAIKLKLTFYDASYLHIAMKNGLTLVSEDGELREKSKEVKVKAMTVSEYVKERTQNNS